MESLWKPGIHVWEASFIIGMAELQLCLRQKVDCLAGGGEMKSLSTERTQRSSEAWRKGMALGAVQNLLAKQLEGIFSPSEGIVRRMLLPMSPVK